PVAPPGTEKSELAAGFLGDCPAKQLVCKDAELPADLPQRRPHAALTQLLVQSMPSSAWGAGLLAPMVPDCAPEDLQPLLSLLAAVAE
ncbi:unnamed protein product, partial [Polarella glacialis]